MDQRAIIEKARQDLVFLQGDVLGVLLYGSWATGEGHEKSDIDICIVAPSVEDKTALWRSVIAAVRDDSFDARLFELMPLYLKMAVIEQGVVVYARDVLELYEYFYPFRRIWGDQKHRQTLSRKEMREMLGRAADLNRIQAGVFLPMGPLHLVVLALQNNEYE